jgi:hypothetical protein
MSNNSLHGNTRCDDCGVRSSVSRVRFDPCDGGKVCDRCYVERGKRKSAHEDRARYDEQPLARSWS